MAKSTKSKEIRCSFCGKSQNSVERIIAGPGVYICNECIKVCSNIVEDELYENNETEYTVNKQEKLPTPEEIKAVFGMSKGSFKRAVGRLFKNKLIMIEEDGLYKRKGR